MNAGPTDKPRLWCRRGLALVLVLALAGCAREYTAGDLVVAEPWGRATPPGAKVGAAYMTIRNAGAHAIRLQGGATPLAQSVEIHTMSVDKGVMRMRPAPAGVEVPAHGSISLTPGGIHLMLVGLKRPLVEGETAPLTLVFDGDVKVRLELKIKGVAG